MAVVRSPDFLRALIRETALATLIHQRRLTPSCGGQVPTAERTVGPARMIAESLTPKPGIREQYLPTADSCAAASYSITSSARRRYRGRSCGCRRRCYDSRSRNVRAIYASSGEFALLAPAATITRTCTISTHPQEPRTP